MNYRFFNARILKTKADHSFEIVKGQLWVRGDRISYIGSDEANEAGNMTWDREIDVCGNLLMPGFKNAHTHTAMTFLRSYADDMPLDDWLNKQVFPKEALLTPDDAYTLNILGIMEYLTSGITCNFDMYNFTDMNAKASMDCGFRTVLASPFNDFTSSLEELELMYEKYNKPGDLISFVPAFHAVYTTSYEHLKGLSDLTHKLKAPVWAHNSETVKEVADCKAKYGLTPTQLMDELGLFDYGGGGYHCLYFDDKDVDVFARRGLSVITNPASNLKLASGIAPMMTYLKRGINLGIGTDGPASNNCLDVFREMFLVSGLAKVKENDAKGIPAEEVLYMATAGGAKAMGLDDCDCLEEGKKADIIMIDLAMPNMQPLNNIVTNLVYSGSKINVKMTMIDGIIRYEDGVFELPVAPSDIYDEANKIIGRMS